MDEIRTLEERLNDRDYDVRISAAEKLGELIREGKVTRTVTGDVNNHVHTKFSFSPYYPTAAVYAAWKSGLKIVGSIDHDSISAARETKKAAACFGIESTTGFEMRVSFRNTQFGDRKINNPDSKGIVYMCIHGVPDQNVEKVQEFLKPINRVRNIRNRKQTEALCEIVKPYGLELDFDRDVYPLSEADKGGSITERHILYALSLKTIEKYGKGQKLVDFITDDLKLPLNDKMRNNLLDEGNIHYAYDLLGLFKSNFLPRFFIQPNEEECPDVREVVKFANSIGAIAAYAYLGDVGDSVTGDKKAEKFEDDFLDELVALLKDIGYPAITYMPPRNTVAQMKRLQALAKKHGLMEISGVDINSSRQVFSCPELFNPECCHLVDSAYALVAHELLSTKNISDGLFSKDNRYADRPLEERIEMYAEIGKGMDPFRPLETTRL